MFIHFIIGIFGKAEMVQIFKLGSAVLLVEETLGIV